MNPFGIIQAILLAAEAVVRVISPERRKETYEESWGFFAVYWSLLLMGAGIVGWAIYSLYFAK